MAIIDDEGLKDFVESNISDDFGLSISDLVEHAKGEGRFSAWLNDNTDNIKEVLNAVKDRGASPALFTAYEITEQHTSPYGWLNHTNAKSDPVEDAKSVADWLVDEANDTGGQPAWVDVGTNNLDFVPEDVKSEGNDHYDSLEKGAIGRAVIAGTAAATWEVYYPKGLKEEYNEVQDYDAPLTAMKDMIADWGGDIEGGSGGGKKWFIFPVPEPYRITQEYKGSEHFGIDIAGESPGDKPDILAIADGKVVQSYVSDSYGEVLMIKHEADGKEWEGVYAHLDNGSREFEAGDDVGQGDKIGVMGETGQAEGVHLHFELHQPSWNDGKTNAVDPEDYLDVEFGEGGDGEEEEESFPYWLLLRQTNMRRMGVRGRG